MLTPSGILPDSQINAAITDVYRQLQDVRKIRFERRSDWSGEDAIYFRILISDDAAKTRLHETMKRVEATLESILDPVAIGLHVYYRVRSESEQAVLQDKSWSDVLS